MEGYWEDRLTETEYAGVEAAITRFRKKRRRTRADEHVLYEALTNAGLEPEEADEMINMEKED